MVYINYKKQYIVVKFVFQFVIMVYHFISKSKYLINIY